MGCSGDMKFTQKYAVLEVTHEAHVDPEDERKCLASRSQRDMLVVTQSAHAVMCGYCGGYTSKAEEVGKEEVLCFFSFFLRFVLFFLVFVFFSERVLCVCACRTGVNIDVIDEEDNMFVGITL